jgi:CheY-like chemotaxis protein
MLARAFRRAHVDAKPLFFADGAALVHHAEGRHRPKLLLLDLQMPLMNGLEALHALRQGEGFGETPVVIFSSDEDIESVRAAYAAGATLYLKKPHRLEEFNDVARLCVTCVDGLRELPPDQSRRAAPLSVQQAVELLCNTHGPVGLSQTALR